MWSYLQEFSEDHKHNQYLDREGGTVRHCQRKVSVSAQRKCVHLE